MKILIILLFLLGIVISGCLSSQIKEVPVVKVDITFVEKQGDIEPDNYTLVQGTINYIDRPVHTQAQSFPAIGARTMISKGKNSTIGPWEMIPYKGSGTYSFNIGFDEKHYPAPNDTVHVSIYLLGKNSTTGKGETIGAVVNDIIWK